MHEKIMQSSRLPALGEAGETESYDWWFIELCKQTGCLCQKPC